MRHYFRCLIYCLTIAFSATFAERLYAMEYFVCPDGSDTSPGTRQQPFATIGKASSVLKPGDVCYLREGIYREVLRPEQSGKAGEVITFSNYRGEQVIISGADPISGWKSEGEGIYSAPMSWTWPDGNQVFCNGKMLSEACWPNAGEEHLFQPTRAVAQGGSENSLQCDDIPGPKDAWKGAQLWCAGGAAWICWVSNVTGYDNTTRTLTFDEAREGWYKPGKGNLFVLRGVRRALDAPGEWFYDAETKRLLLIPPNGEDIAKLQIEAKRRPDAIDLSGRSYIHINGLQFRAAGLRTDEDSSHIVLNGLTGSYVSHSYKKDVGGRYGVQIAGSNNLVLNCDLGYSSASVLAVSGRDHRIINCNIHHGGYAGLWTGTVQLQGRRILFSHNTVRHAGRDLISMHGLMESLVQYNDVSDAGWLTKDLGMLYGHNTDFANTEFRYNLVHDNHAADCAMGIYFDHLSHNAIVHHNVLWNVGDDPVRFNNPSYNNLVFNNTCLNTGQVSTFDHSKRDDLFASRYYNNVFNEPPRLPDHVVLKNNSILPAPEVRDAVNKDFRLKDKALSGIGAYAPADRLWRAGCDLKNPPHPLPVYETSRIPWMNMVKNACFELGTFEGWEKMDAAKAELVEGNGWGNNWGKGKVHATGTSKYELKLGPGKDGIQQTIKELTPNTTYTLSAWMRVSDENETIVLGVKGHGMPEASISLSAIEWTRSSIDFTTGQKATEATIYLRKSSPGEGSAWGDNVTLPLTPKDMRDDAAAGLAPEMRL
jgi:hypothetical protein